MATEFHKWFENQINDAGMTLQSRVPAFWHRFPDSHAARGALPSQPGDFQLVGPNGTVLIEAKTSEKHKSLRGCAASHIDAAQVGHHLLWTRTTQKSVFLFMSDVSGCIEVWDGEGTASCRKTGTALKLDYLLKTTPYSEDALYAIIYGLFKQEKDSE